MTMNRSDLTIDIDIIKKMERPGRPFHLRSQFTSTDRALVLFGPSGSGKTLTLRAIAGLLVPDRGRIAVKDDVLFDAAYSSAR